MTTGGPSAPDEWLDGRKVFHVSPFLPVEGGYRFRFRLDDERVHVDVNYHDAQGLMLATSVGGRREALRGPGRAAPLPGQSDDDPGRHRSESIGRPCNSGESGRDFTASLLRPRSS